MNNDDVTLRIAKVCHEANRAYCACLGDQSHLAWEDAPNWQRESVIAGVKFCLANPITSAEKLHEAWMSLKLKDGWRWGPVKDSLAKTHPCLLPFFELDFQQRNKDVLFGAIVNALK